VHDLLDLLFKLGTWHHHPAATGGADRTNIGTQSRYAPLLPTTRVGFPQTHNVIQL
jgi:hypothetical protein